MSHTSRLTKDIHIHTPILRSMMTYTNLEGQKKAHLLDLNDRDATALLNRTLRWATRNGVEITLRPV